MPTDKCRKMSLVDFLTTVLVICCISQVQECRASRPLLPRDIVIRTSISWISESSIVSNWTRSTPLLPFPLLQGLLTRQAVDRFLSTDNKNMWVWIKEQQGILSETDSTFFLSLLFFGGLVYKLVRVSFHKSVCTRIQNSARPEKIGRAAKVSTERRRGKVERA